MYVEGRIQTRSYDDREGNKRYITEVVAQRVQFLGRREEPASGGAAAAEPEPEPQTAVDEDVPF